MLADRVRELTDGKFDIRVFAGGEIVPGLQVLDAVSNGTVEIGHTCSYYYVGKNKAFGFDTSMPFGLNSRQQNAWMQFGGGDKLMAELFDQYKVIALAGGNTGTQMGGWFRNPIKGLADLKGKNVVTTAGTTSERLARKLNEDRALGMRIIAAKDHGESFLMLETGRAAAFMMDDALLYGELAKARRPDDWVVVGEPQSLEAYGCVMRKDDPAFKRLVDATIAGLQTGGEARRIYAKWFESPIPPKGLNLNFPLSPVMVELFANPNDRPLQ